MCKLPGGHTKKYTFFGENVRNLTKRTKAVMVQKIVETLHVIVWPPPPGASMSCFPRECYVKTRQSTYGVTLLNHCSTFPRGQKYIFFANISKIIYNIKLRADTRFYKNIQNFSKEQSTRSVPVSSETVYALYTPHFRGYTCYLPGYNKKPTKNW